MKDKHDNLPFWGKQKPLKHYFEYGVIRFSVKNGTLSYLVRKITKTNWATITKGKVRDQQHLKALLNAKSFDDVLSLEIVIP